MLGCLALALVACAQSQPASSRAAATSTSPIADQAVTAADAAPGVAAATTALPSASPRRTPQPAPLLGDWRDIPVVAPDYAAQQASVGGSTSPARVSPDARPTPFNPAAYRRDPAAYLGIIEPGRIWAPAEPGPDVPELTMVGEDRVQVTELGQVLLHLRAAPRAPVTLTSLDLGAFANGLTSITVQADDAGEVQVPWTATAGTIAGVRILAASPVLSRQVLIGIQVLPPSQASAPSPRVQP